MNIFSIIILILFILNGLHCLILAVINRYILVKIGKRKNVFLDIGRPTDLTDLYKAVKSDESLSKYKNFSYHFIVAFIAEVVLFIIFLISML
jgi:hypothetical protein